jgi:predicted nucleic acid-binding protein
MTDYVADASVALKWFVPEELGDAAERLIASGHPLHAPRFLAVETVNAAWKNWRKRLIGEAIVRDVGAKLEELVDAWHADELLLPEAAKLALGLSHPVFDCLYLVLARRLGTAVVTTDKRLLAIAPPGLALDLADWCP